MAWELCLTFPSLAFPQGPPMILSAAKDFSQLSKLKVSQSGWKRGAETPALAFEKEAKSQSGQMPWGIPKRSRRQWPPLILFSNNCNSEIA